MNKLKIGLIALILCIQFAKSQGTEALVGPVLKHSNQNSYRPIHWGPLDCVEEPSATEPPYFTCEFEVGKNVGVGRQTLMKITKTGQLNVLGVNSNNLKINTSTEISAFEHGTKEGHKIRDIGINYLADGKSNITISQLEKSFDVTTSPPTLLTTDHFRNLTLTPEVITMGYIPEIDQTVPQAPGQELKISPDKIRMVEFVWASGGSPDVDQYVTSVEPQGITTPKVTTKVWEAPPDYVFEPDYDLKSLDEIEKFIKTNKHLPEIPSAKEIEKDGIDLASMNMKLLKKIEELTLHTIAMNKELQKQKEELNRLKSQK